MRRTAAITPLIALATLFASGAADAAEWHNAPPAASASPASAAAQAEPRAAAEGYLQEAAAELRLQGVELRYKTTLNVGASRTVRFTQQYAGLPVIGGAAAVRLGSDGRVRAAVLDVARGLAVSPSPSLDENKARAAVDAWLGMTPVVEPRTSLAILPDGEGPGHLVWMVDVFPATSRAMRYLVDAHDGQLVGARPLTKDVLGRVYPISSVNTPQPMDLELKGIDVAAPQMLNAWKGNLTVTNYVSGGTMGAVTVEQTLTPNMGQDFLYDPPADPLDNKDAFAQVGLFYHINRIHDYFQDQHGIDFSPASWKLTAVANMEENGMPLDNAYFSDQGITGAFASPNLLAIGQGTTLDFADDSDVFLHEFGHYVSGNAIGYNLGQTATDKYGLSPWSGSIDEGIADFFACSVNNDPLLGEATLKPLGAERDLSNTKKVCPNDLMGEVHADGELIGSLSWSLRVKLGQTLGDQVVWGALTTLTPGASFADFTKGIQMTAADMMAQGKLVAADITAINDILAARGMDDCDHVLAVSDTKQRVTTMFGLDLISQLLGASCTQLRGFGVALQSLFHFQATPAPTDKGLRFSVDMTTQGGKDIEWSIYVRTATSVGFKAGMFLPTVSKFDYSVEKIKALHGEIVIDETSNPPFDPTQTYYMVIGHTSCPTTVATISASAITDAGAGGAGGMGGAGGAGGGDGGAGGNTTPTANVTEDTGCGCRVVGDEDRASQWLSMSGLAFAAAAAFVRRRRQG